MPFLWREQNGNSGTESQVRLLLIISGGKPWIHPQVAGHVARPAKGIEKKPRHSGQGSRRSIRAGLGYEPAPAPRCRGRAALTMSPGATVEGLLSEATRQIYARSELVLTRSGLADQRGLVEAFGQADDYSCGQRS